MKYGNLGLVITDEQHRFGVNQRANLKNKGIAVDVLYMSATPIPRTYALTIYGDMDISTIKQLPSGRKPVKTVVKSEKEMKDVLTSMHEELKNNHQIIITTTDLKKINKKLLGEANIYKIKEGKIIKLEEMKENE